MSDTQRLEPAASLEADVLQLSGDWTLASLHGANGRSLGSLKGPAQHIDASGIGRLDAAGADRLLAIARALDIDPSAIEVPAERQPLLDIVAAEPESDRAGKRPAKPGVVERVGGVVEDFAGQAKTLIGFFGMTLETLLRVAIDPRRWRVTSTLHHMEAAGFDAVPLVTVLSFLIGAVVAFLGATVLSEFGAEIYVVELVSFAFMREFGVLLTAILLAGRTASSFTAQIGAMKSQQEIDAIRVLGLDPVEVLVIPRVVAMLIMLPLLAFLATVAGLAGGVAVGALGLGITPELFLSRLDETRELRHLLTGLGKAPIFALVIALVGCLEGFKVTGSAQSVGERTTSAVVQAIFLVIVIDAIAAIFYMEMGW